MEDLRDELEMALEAIEVGELDRLVEAGDPEDFEALRELALDPETAEKRRRRALYGLARWPGREEEALDVVRSVVRSLSELERVTAVDALGRLDRTEAREELRELRGDPSPEVRRQVVIALARIGDDVARAELERMADVEQVDHVRELARERASELADGTGGGV